MRDVIVLIFTLGAVYFALKRPWTGVLSLAVLAYMNPHRYAWGFSRNLPVYLIVFISTMAGLFLSSEDREPFPWTRETKLFIMLLAWFTFTTFWSPDYPQDTQEQWVKVMKIYLGIFPTFWLINTKEKLRWLLMVIALSFGLIGLKGGIFAIGTGFNHRVWGPDNTFYGGNNEIALALNMSLPLLLLSAREVSSRPEKYFLYACFVGSILSIISSWSRGGLITLCVVLGLLTLMSRRKLLLVPFIVILVVIMLPNLPEEWFDRMHTISDYKEDGSMQGRYDSWENALERAQKDPLTGGGFGMYHDARDAHSAYFQILGEHGFVALGLWLTLLFGTILGLEQSLRKSWFFEETAWMNGYARALQISLIGYAVGGMALGVAYWDIFYHLVAISVVLKVMLTKAERNMIKLSGTV